MWCWEHRKKQIPLPGKTELIKGKIEVLSKERDSSKNEGEKRKKHEKQKHEKMIKHPRKMTSNLIKLKNRM